MSMSRIRSRVAVIAGALPMLLVLPPGVSFASGEYVVQNVIANGQVIGPNVGFLGHGIGVSGTTPVFKITAPSESATIANVKLTLTSDNTALNTARDPHAVDAGGVTIHPFSMVLLRYGRERRSVDRQLSRTADAAALPAALEGRRASTSA